MNTPASFKRLKTSVGRNFDGAGLENLNRPQHHWLTYLYSSVLRFWGALQYHMKLMSQSRSQAETWERGSAPRSFGVLGKFLSWVYVGGRLARFECSEVYVVEGLKNMNRPTTPPHKALDSATATSLKPQNPKSGTKFRQPKPKSKHYATGECWLFHIVVSENKRTQYGP